MADCEHDQFKRYCDRQRVAVTVREIVRAGLPTLHRVYACSSCGYCYICYDHAECPQVQESCEHGCPAS